MKSPYIVTALLVALASMQPGRAQSVTPAPQKPGADQKTASDDESVKKADEAVRRAASNDQQPGYGHVTVAPRLYPLPQRLEKAAYLGLSTSPPPPALRHQLKLPEGTALVVDFVQPKSPAQQAGMKQYDLLVKLNDQLLINSEQLAVLVRTFKPGEEIHLDLLREGERRSVGVKLVERELPPLGDVEMQYQVLPRTDEQIAPVPDSRPNRRGGGGGARSGNPFVTPPQRTLTWLDGNRQITVALDGDNKTLTVSDAKTGKVLYKGSLDDLDQQKDLPPEAQDALARLKQFLKAYSDKPGGPKDDSAKSR
jgi:hypothetical protein